MDVQIIPTMVLHMLYYGKQNCPCPEYLTNIL